MQTIIEQPLIQEKSFFSVSPVVEPVIKNKTIPPLLERKLIWLAIKIRIFFLACITLKYPGRIWKGYKQLLKLRSNVWGGSLKKVYKVGGKYYYNMYTPEWPSALYDSLIKNELKRKAFDVAEQEKPTFVFLAITRKCPMRCEHCFEWDNLNQKESFSKDDLYKTVGLFQKEGVLQFYLSGGEPMVRFKDLVDLLKFTGKKTECWILTSGFNVTKENARILKEAGCKGMAVSIDHYIPELHNMFRGHIHAFDHAVNAVKNAREAGLVTAISVCVTREFIDGHHMVPYMDLAKQLGVQFVQVLEPRSVGHYEGKDVYLRDHHIKEMEALFKLYNDAAAYKDHPTMLYHGFHQRRVGCFAGGRSIYVDSAGDVHDCPFCHTSSYNIISYVREGNDSLPMKKNQCSYFGKIA